MPSHYRKNTNLITNESDALQARHFILNSLKDCKVAKIASGYIGLGAFKEALEPFKRILESGGQVTLILGLGYWEGISPELEKLLREFHNLAIGINKNSGVFFLPKTKVSRQVLYF